MEKINFSGDKEDSSVKNNQTKSITKNFIKYSENYYFKLAVTGLTIFFAYLFYLLGYSFVYGYYFGGSISGIINPIDILISQIPFDIRYISVLGIIIFIIALSVFLLMYNIIFRRSILKLFYLTSFLLIFYSMFIVIQFINSDITDQLLDKFLIGNMWFFIFICIIKYVYIRAFKSKNMVADLIRFIVYLFIFIYLDIKIIESLNINKLILDLIILVLAVIEEYLIDIFYISSSDKTEKYIEIYVGVLVIVAFFNVKVSLIMASLLVLKLSLGKNSIKCSKREEKVNRKSKIKAHETSNIVIWVKKSIHLVMDRVLSPNSFILKSFKIVFERVKRFGEAINNENKHDIEDKGNRKILIIVPCILILVISLVFYLGVFNFMSIIGNQIGREVTLNKMNTITFYISDIDKPVILRGIVVKQEDNIYFISTDQRELKIISSLNVIIEPIKETKDCLDDLNDLNDLNIIQ